QYSEASLTSSRSASARMESPSRPSSLINPRAAETSRSRVSPCCLSPSGLTGNDSPLNIVVRVAYLTMLEVMLAPLPPNAVRQGGENDRKEGPIPGDGPCRWGLAWLGLPGRTRAFLRAGRGCRRPRPPCLQVTQQRR